MTPEQFYQSQVEDHKDWMGTACDGEKKTCSYPKCNCPFDMGADNKCLRGYEPKENRIGGGCRQF